ncbi:MAG: hypothetical protein GXO79_14745 [Chlorobi bacterium]|nr:hypothetical protein [Chlorobiota bacterium]
MKINYLYAPFTRIAGLKSLLIGLIGLFITAYLAFLTGTHLNGLLNLDFAKDADFVFYLLENLINWVSISVFLFLSGLLLSKSRIRIIDIFGTSVLSRLPLIIAPLIRSFPFLQSFVFQSWKMYLIIVFYLVSVIWTIILLFNGFRISCNLKNERLIISFIISILFSEIVTRMVIYLLIFKT